MKHQEMTYKKIQWDFDYILWLKARMETLRNGINRKIETDHSTDFEMLANKLKHYEIEYASMIDELYSLLRECDVSRKTDNFWPPD